MKDTMNIIKPMKGFVTLEYLQTGQKYQFENTILPSAIEIVTGRLAGLDSSALDYIKLYNASILVCPKLIASTAKVSANEVEFFTIFQPADFSGAFDEAQLWCNSIGAFAGLTSLVQSKPADQQLAVTWKIKLV